jgi:hypothetical protein
MLVSKPAKQEYERLFHGPRKTHDTTEGADDDYDEDFSSHSGTPSTARA